MARFMFRFSVFAFCLVIFAANAAIASDTTYHISGTFAESVSTDPFRPDPGPYPFSQLLGGSFRGTFAVDHKDRPDKNGSIRLKSVSIDIIAKSGDVVQTITRMSIENNVMVSGTHSIYLVFGHSSDILNDALDLRIKFNRDPKDQAL